MKTRALLIAAAVMIGAAAPAAAHDYTVGQLAIDHPWARATPPGAKVAGGYLSISNKGKEPDRLVAVSLEAAGRSEIHEMKMNNGVMTMRPVDAGLTIKPGETVKLDPGGYHLMFMELKQPFKKDDSIKGELTFEKAGKVAVEFKVESLGASGSAHDAKKQHSH